MSTSQTQQAGSLPPSAHEAGRGRHAESPTEMPKAGWRDILIRTKDEMAKDNLSIVAAGVAFYAFVAFVPALGAVVGLYALIADPAQVSEHLTALGGILPGEVMPLLREQMERLVSSNQAAGISVAISLAIAVYSSSKAITAIITGLNIAYDEEEKRGFIKLQALALFLTLGAVIGVVVGIGLLAILPAMIGYLQLPSWAENTAQWLRWPVLIGGFVVALAVVYRWGPSREGAQWKWISPGALTAATLWLVGSGAFSLYVATLGSYEKTYGSLGALVVFLMWLFLTAYVVLVGAELNSEMERQTVKDTTTGPPKPLGHRRAYSADTVGPATS